MLKNILNLNGVEQLSNAQQKSISGSLRKPIDGGSFPCSCNGVYKKDCDSVQCCIDACA